MLRIYWIGIFAIFIFSFCGKPQSESRKNKPKDSLASKEIAEKVEIDYTDSGLLKARIKTPIMIAVKNIKDPYVEMPKGIRVDFFDSEMRPESYLNAEYGISFQKKKKIIVKRNVEVLNIKGEKLNTEELIWDQNTGRITTDKFVKITTKDQIIMGEGMESDQTFSDWEIKNVSGTINIQNDSTSHHGASSAGGGGH